MYRRTFATTAEYLAAQAEKLAERDRLESLPAEPNEIVMETVDLNEYA